MREIERDQHAVFGVICVVSLAVHDIGNHGSLPYKLSQNLSAANYLLFVPSPDISSLKFERLYNFEGQSFGHHMTRCDYIDSENGTQNP